MTNKSILSDELELLESLAAYVADSPNAVMRARSVQLRALLDKPAKTSGYCSDYQNCECMDKTKSGREACENWVSWGKPSTCAESQVEPACKTPSGNTCPGDGVGSCEKCPAAQHQGEPVAIVDESDDGLFIELIYGENGSPLKRGDKLYAEQPEPATVVMSDVSAVQMEHNRLVRELDVLLNGEAGAAQQASLCDIVAQVRLKRDLLIASLNQGAPADLHFPTMLRKMWSGGEVQQWIEAQGPLYRKAPVLSGANAALQRVYDVIGLDYSHDVSVLIENFKNANRFADYLDAVEHEFFMVPGEPSDEPEDEGLEPMDVCLVHKFPARSVEHYVDQFRAALAVLAGKSPLAQAVVNAGAVAHLYNSGAGMLAWIEGERASLTTKVEPDGVRE